MNIGQIFGGLVGGYLGGRYGPKKTIQVHIIFVSIGWLMQGLAPNLAVLIAGRVVLGLAQCLNIANNSLLLVQYRYINIANHFKGNLHTYCYVCGILPYVYAFVALQREEELFFHQLV